MAYVLILKSGKVMVFSVKAVAELYRSNNGGTLVSTYPCEANIKRITETYVGV
jgi:hypothetical protein